MGNFRKEKFLNHEKKIALLFAYNLQTIAEIKTTEIYTHVTSKAIQGRKSPLDDLKIEITDEH